MILEKIKCSCDDLSFLVAMLSRETGRSDAVISNFLKTLFFRLERETVIQKLNSIEVSVCDSNNQFKSFIDILKELSIKYTKLNNKEQLELAEDMSGIFHITLFKSLLISLKSFVS